MSILAGFIAGLWLVTALLHGVLGTREILNPVLASEIGRIPKRTSEVAWHILTWQFFVLGLAGVYVVVTQLHTSAFAALSLSMAIGAAALFVVNGLRHFGDVWRMPQWILFAGIALLSSAALLRGVSMSAAAPVARYVAATLLALIALLHVAWALGSPFPLRSSAELARYVIGVAPRGKVMPGRGATWFVAFALVGAAACVLALGHPDSPWLSRVAPVGALLLALVFTLRGIGGFFEPALRPVIIGTPYMTWSRVFYSPLSLLLAILIGVGLTG